MPPVRALSARDHELFAEPFSLTSMLACGKTLLGGTAARAATFTLAVAVVATAALPQAHRPETVPGANAVAAPVTFVLKHAPAIPPARHPRPKPAAAVRPAPSAPRPVGGAAPPAPAPPPARAAAPHAQPHPAAPTPRAAPAPAPKPSAPPPPPAPPVEAPHPVVPTLPPLPPVTDPQQPDVDRPSLPLGP